MNFSVNREVVKLLELIEKSPVLQRMAWALIFILFIVAVRWW